MPEQDLTTLFGGPQPFPDLTYSDPEAVAREKAIWEKINKGPRQRAKELAAQEWENRYGIKETSGKGRRVLGGIGELLRGIAQGSKYESIDDKAAERGLKEYQAEVGPLQRELGVLSQAKSAAMRVNQKAVSDAEENKIKQVLAMSRLGVDQANISKVLGVTEPEQIKILESQARIGNLEAQAALRKRQTQDLELRGGLTGTPANAKVQSEMSPEQQNGINRAIFGNTEAASMGKLSGSPDMFKSLSGGGTRTSTTMRDVPAGVGPGGMQLFEQRPSTTTSQTAPRNVFDAAKAGSAVESFKQRLGMVAQTAREGNTPDSPVAVFESPNGNQVAFKRNNTPPKMEVTVENGQTVARPKLDTLLKDTLAPYFPSVDWNHSTATPRNYTNISRVAMPKKELSQQDQLNQAYIDSGKRLAENGMREYIKGQLGDTSGILGNVKGGLSRMFGKSSTGQTLINTQAKDMFAKYSLAMTGKSSNPTEKRRFEEILPATTDNERTFMQKALTGIVLASQTEWMNGLNLKGELRDKLMMNKSILTSPEVLTNQAFRHMEAARMAIRSGRSTYRLGSEPGSPEYNVSDADKIAWKILNNTSKQMQDSFWQTFPDGAGIAPPITARKQ